MHLDDPAALITLDPGGMLEAVRRFPDQCRDAVAIGREFTPPRLRPDAVVILGLGGSAIGGDLLRSYAAPRCPVPIVVCRDYDIPAFVSKNTLVVAVSCSGNTEETLAAYHHALSTGATIMAFTTGGALAPEAAARGQACCLVPGGLQPRAALGYGFFPLLIAFQKLGLLPDQAADIDDALREIAAVRDRCAPAVPQRDNPAKQLAQRLLHKIPVIYGSTGDFGMVAYRWKSQINENAKGMAFWNQFPELNHNETVGWSGPAALNKDLAAVILRGRGDPPRIRRRIDLTKGIIQQQASVEEAWASGSTPLGQILSLTALGDWMSVYLALARGQDPTPVAAIDYLKRELANTP